MAYSKQDLVDLNIDKERLASLTKGELAETTNDTRNGLNTPKPSLIGRSSLSQSFSAVSRSGLSQSYSDVTRS